MPVTEDQLSKEKFSTLLFEARPFQLVTEREGKIAIDPGSFACLLEGRSAEQYISRNVQVSSSNVNTGKPAQRTEIATRAFNVSADFYIGFQSKVKGSNGIVPAGLLKVARRFPNRHLGNSTYITVCYTSALYGR
jgi:hypothetical protein